MPHRRVHWSSQRHRAEQCIKSFATTVIEWSALRDVHVRSFLVAILLLALPSTARGLPWIRNLAIWSVHKFFKCWINWKQLCNPLGMFQSTVIGGTLQAARPHLSWRRQANHWWQVACLHWPSWWIRVHLHVPTAVVSIRKKLQLATSNVESSSWRNFRWSRTMPRPVSELRHIRSWIWLAWLAASGRGANEDHDGLSKFVLSEKLGIAMCRFAGYQSLSQRQT